MQASDRDVICLRPITVELVKARATIMASMVFATVDMLGLHRLVTQFIGRRLTNDRHSEVLFDRLT